jgi:hypothetical protein
MKFGRLIDNILRSVILLDFFNDFLSNLLNVNLVVNLLRYVLLDLLGFFLGLITNLLCIEKLFLEIEHFLEQGLMVTNSCARLVTHQHTNTLLTDF